MNAPAGAPTPDTLRQIVERLEGAAHDLETALGLARRSGSLPVIRDNIRDAAEDVQSIRTVALADLAEIEAAARAAAVRAYGVDPVTSPA